MQVNLIAVGDLELAKEALIAGQDAMETMGYSNRRSYISVLQELLDQINDFPPLESITMIETPPETVCINCNEVIKCMLVKVKQEAVWYHKESGYMTCDLTKPLVDPIRSNFAFPD